MKSSDVKPKVCTKLFSRHNSDSRILSSSANDNFSTPKSSENSKVKECSTEGFTLLKSQSCKGFDTPSPLSVIKNESLVTETCEFIKPMKKFKINTPAGLKIASPANQQIMEGLKFTNLDSKKCLLVPIKNSNNNQSLCNNERTRQGYH